MQLDFMFFVNSIFLGIGLAMDAFSVSIANGLSHNNIKKSKMLLISSTFGIFQGVMPLLGWLCVNFLLNFFNSFESFIPYIALVLLASIGTKMIIDGVKNQEETSPPSLGFIAILVQGIATSIDALSVGFTISDYSFIFALICSTIIAIITFSLCLAGTFIGKKFGNKLSNKATIFGGIILIIIGIEIFLSHIL